MCVCVSPKWGVVGDTTQFFFSRLLLKQGVCVDTGKSLNGFRQSPEKGKSKKGKFARLIGWGRGVR